LLIERMGHEAQLCAKSADGEFNAIVDKALRLAEGTQVRFDVAPEKVHVFDAATERRL
jgi:multiple sugar transport system ATP-binding protein